MRPFFITGFPRSRTKWFAEYFNGIEGVTCHHQFSNGCYSKESLLEKMRASSTDYYVGNSDSLLPFFDISDYGQSTVIVIRPKCEVVSSLNRAGFITTPQDLERLDAQDVMHSYGFVPGYRVLWGMINTELRGVHNFLLPQIPFDNDYANFMIHKNIQIQQVMMMSPVTYHRVIKPQVDFYLEAIKKNKKPTSL